VTPEQWQRTWENARARELAMSERHLSPIQQQLIRYERRQKELMSRQQDELRTLPVTFNCPREEQ
jgi:hypothetical protein